MSTWGGGADAPKEPCPICDKLIDPRGRRDHNIAKHGARPRAKTRARRAAGLPKVDPAEVEHLLYRTVVTTFPSGARSIVTTGPGVHEAHFELPYHEDDIYARLLDPAAGQGETK